MTAAMPPADPHSMPPTFEDIAYRLATAQHGVVTRRQLLEAGIGPGAIDRRLRNGRLRRLHRGVFLVGPVAPPLAAEMAACLACGPGAVLSHRSAARLWGLLEARREREPVTVTVTAPGSGRSHRRVRVHRSRTVGSDEVTRRRGLPVTTPARTLVDLARVLRPASLERATAEAVALGLTTPAELSAALHRHGGRPGAPKLRAALGGSGPALTRSEAEARFLELLRRAGVDPPEANVMVAGHELDFYWPRLRLAVEVDGHAYHSSHHAFERDRRRDAELVGAGVRVMRVTWRQITREPEALLVTLGGALSVASGPRGR